MIGLRYLTEIFEGAFGNPNAYAYRPKGPGPNWTFTALMANVGFGDGFLMRVAAEDFDDAHRPSAAGAWFVRGERVFGF
jgi:hypothetical protein